MNETRFDGKGEIYAKARPKYAQALFDFLTQNEVITSDSIVADIGAGTGIFTVQIAETAKMIYAVEPNADMREKAEIAFEDYLNIISVSATAENTTLKDNSVHCVTVAQAFHWFNRDAFRKECQRILKPNGAVILIWNDRDSESEIIRANYELNKTYCRGFKGTAGGMDFKNSNFSEFFCGTVQTKIFHNPIWYDKEAFIGRNLSSSYAPKSSDANYAAYVEELGILFDKFSKDGEIEYPYITRCYIGVVE